MYGIFIQNKDRTTIVFYFIATKWAIEIIIKNISWKHLDYLSLLKSPYTN